MRKKTIEMKILRMMYQKKKVRSKEAKAMELTRWSANWAMKS